MARFDDLPDKILAKIFSYLKRSDIIHSIRNVCTRWKKVTENRKLWSGWKFCPCAKMTENDIIDTLQSMPTLREFLFLGKYNVLKSLSENCRKIRTLFIPYIHISADDLHLIMKSLPELIDLRITVNPTPEGLQITRIVGTSNTLMSLELRSSGQEEVMEGLLMPIADGCPNLSNLRCANFNCPDTELCYLMQRKRCQLLAYYHDGVVSGSLIQALNECPILKRIVFTRASFKEPFPKIPHITRLQNLNMLEVLKCYYPMLHLIPLTLFRNTLPHLSYIRICHIFGNVDFLINKILLKCPLLTHLDLKGNHELTCKALRNIGSCKLLRHLDVSHCQNVDMKAIQYVADGCPKIQHLSVSGIRMSDDLFRQILRCRSLTLLAMAYTDVSVIDLDLISTNIPGLKVLYIGPKFKFGHDCTRDIKQHMPRLDIRALQFINNIQDYNTITDEFVNLYIKNVFVPSVIKK